MSRIKIYGAGLFGLTVGRILHDKGHLVNIYEKSPFIGGALRTELTPDGVELSKHGAHIFHTDYDNVIDFVKKYSDWTPYYHRVQALIRVLGMTKLVELPLSYKTLSDFYGVDDVRDLEWLRTSSTRMKHPNKSVDELISKIGWDLFDYVIRPYSENQWNCDISEIPEGVIDRIGFKDDFVTGYFTDKFQGVPADGWMTFINRLAEGLDIECNVKTFEYDPECITIYTGAVDELFGEHRLEYRTLWWDFKVLESPLKYDLPVINTPQESHTRMIIHNNFPNQPKIKNVYVSYEYPMTWYPDSKMERYYPVNNKGNNELYEYYVNSIKVHYPNLILGGRLGSYKYYDMDDTIYNAIKLAESL